MFAPAIQSIIDARNYPTLTLAEVDEFIAAREHVVLFFPEMMKPLPEAADVAVILGEIARSFEGQLEVAVVAWNAQRDLQLRYRFNKFPALVFLRRGEYLGAISGVLDWGDYVIEVERLLAAEPSEPPPMNLPGGRGVAPEKGVNP